MLCELGNPFKRNQRVSVPPLPRPFLGPGSRWGWAERLAVPVPQAELIITFEAIGITLDTREVAVWLDLST